MAPESSLARVRWRRVRARPPSRRAGLNAGNASGGPLLSPPSPPGWRVRHVRAMHAPEVVFGLLAEYTRPLKQWELPSPGLRLDSYVYRLD